MKLFLKTVLGALLISATAIANAAFINFDSYNITGYASQDKAGSAYTEDSGYTLTLEGNQWVDIDFISTIASDTVISFTFIATGLNAELYGIAFDNDDSYNFAAMNEFIFVGGSQTGDIMSANTVDSYASGDGAVTYNITVGDLFTGTFDRIVFILDNDDNEAGSIASFSNIEFCTTSSPCSTSVVDVNAPSNLAVVGILFILAAFVRRRISS